MENHFENIDAYFSETMSAEEKKEFERRVVEDRSFAEEIAFYLSAREAAKDEVAKEKKEWFRQLLKENPPTGKVRQLTPVRRIGIYRLAAAASVIGLLFLGWYLFFNPAKSAEQMASEYFNTELKELKVTMAVVQDSLQQGKNLYNNGKLVEAARFFETMIQRNSSDFEAIKHAGLAQLALENYDNALSYFRSLEKFDSYYANPAKFYQALTLMKRNRPEDKQLIKQLLQEVKDKPLEGSETAEQWLKKL
jgi:tetratricopeptide (TPR) repeat protein